MNTFTGIEITKAHQKDFNGIQWVLRTINKKNYMYKGIYFEDGYCVGTDGHRMHIYEYVDEYKNGVYEKVLNTSGKIVLKYIPDQKYLDWTNIPNTPVKPQELELLPYIITLAYTNIVRNMDPSVTIQYDFFNDLFRSTYTKWTAYIYNRTDGVWFVTDQRVGLIMPMHTGENKIP